MQRYLISSSHRPFKLFQPAIYHHRRWLYCLFLVLFLVIQSLNTWSFAIPHAYAAGRPQSPPPSLTFQQFLKQGYVDQAYHGPLLPRSVAPNVRSAARPAHLGNYSTPPPSFEPPTMKAISQPLAASFFVGSTGGSPLDLVGSDKRLEVLIAPGSLDLTHATVSGGTTPVGALTLQLTQLQGHFLGQASQLGIYQLQVVDSQGHVVNGIVLHTPVTVVYHYQPTELSSLNLDARQVLLSWPTLIQAARAAKHSTSSLIMLLHNDPAKHTLSAQSSVFGPGPFTLSGTPANQSPPTSPVGSAQGNSGQFSYSYPLQVAPGSGGFAPQLSLAYSSGGPNGRTTDSSPANNVGDGWSLSFGSISEADNPDGSSWYFLSGVDNVSDRLVKDSALTGGTFYQTEHISYLLVQQITSSLTNQPCFAVWDKSGTYYQFGCSSDSLQSWYDGSTQHYYRWDLNKIIAPNENAGYFNIIQVSYLQDCVNSSGQSASCSSTTTVRDAAMEQISYGYSDPGNLQAAVRTFANTTIGTTVGQVDFSYYAPFNDTNSNNITFATKYPYGSGYQCTPKVSTSLRCDDPVADGSEPAPTVMSTLSLQSMTSYVGTDTTGNKAYGYQFGYHDSPITTTLPTPSGGTVACEDPNAQASEYCAGEHLLTSITPIVYQSSGGHQLPPVTFGYNDPVNAPMINTYYDTTNSLGGSHYAVETAWQYMTSYLDTDTGVGASISYGTAYANTHGAPYYYNSQNELVDDRHDPLYCWLHRTDPAAQHSQCSIQTYNNTTYDYSHPDDRAWSQQVVAVLTSSGADSSAGNLQTVISYAYTLKVTNPNGSSTCTVGTPAGPGSGPTPAGNSDCMGDNWFAPGESDWIDYYHSEYRGFAAVATDHGGNLFQSGGGNLTVASYESTEGWQTPPGDPANFLAGQLDEEDVYQGMFATGSPLLSVVNTYATASGIASPCRTASQTDTTYTPCEVVLLSTRTTQYEGTAIGNSNAPWVENDYTYDDYSIEYGLTEPGPTYNGYHNLTQEVTNSSNAQTVTDKWTYTPQESLGSNWSYYDVNKVTHSEVDDSNNHVWLCQNTTYDEGAPSGVPIPAAGWPTTVKAYSNCGAQSGGVTSYLGYDAFGNLVASVDALAKAQPSLYSSNGCTVSSGALAAAPSIFTSSWSQSSYTSCTLYDSNHVLPVQTTDAFGYSSSVTYDATQGDLPTSSTDLNAQTTSSSYSYDGSSGSNGKVTIDRKLPLEPSGNAYTQQSNTFSSCNGGSATPCFKIESVSQQYQNAVSHTFYDSLGRVVEVTRPVPMPVGGQSGQSYIEVVFTVYNDQTNSVATSVPFITTAPASGIGWIDPNGAKDYTGQAPGLSVTYFDALGRPIASMDPYFSANNPTGVTCPGGSAATACAFYGFGSPKNSSNSFDYTAMLDPNNHVSVSFSDSLGNVRFVQHYSKQYIGPSGIDNISANLNEQEKIAYNALDEPTSVTDTDQNSPTGQNQSVTASASYDDLGRLTSVTDPDRGNHNYAYDQDGNVIGDSSGTRNIGYNYDLLGRLGCVNDAASPAINATGSCTISSNPYLQFVYDIDKLGTKGSTDFPVGRLTLSKATTYFPDGTSATASEQRQYDARGRVIKERLLLSVPSSWEVASQLPSYYQLQPSYNDADQVQYLTTSTSPAGQGYTESNDYDSNTGVLIGVGNDSTQSPNLAKVLYNHNAQLDTIDYKTNSSGSGFLATEQFSYDADLRPTNASASWQAASGTSGTIFSQSPQYDLASNVISLSTTQAAVPGQSSSGGSETQDFCYEIGCTQVIKRQMFAA